MEIGEFKLALRAMRIAFSFAMPWNYSVLAAKPANSVVQELAEPAHKATPPTVFHHVTAAMPAHTAGSPSVAALPMTANGAYKKLLSEFPAVLNPSKQLPPVKHDVVHHIETDGRLVTAKYRCMDLAKLSLQSWSNKEWCADQTAAGPHCCIWSRNLTGRDLEAM
jgi:hypothetical protein